MHQQDTDASLSAQNIKNILRRRGVRILITFTAIFSLFLLLAPMGLRYGAKQWLLNNGADEVVIHKIRLNPFTGSVTIQGVDVTKGAKSVLSNARIELDLGLVSLFSRNINIEKALYEKVTVDLEQLPDGRWRLTSYTTKKGEEPQTVTTENSTPNSWNFLADHVVFSDCIIHLTKPDLQLTLAIDRAELLAFSTLPQDAAGSFTLEGTVNKAPVKLRLDQLMLSPHLNIEGTIQASDLALNDLAEILQQHLTPFTGNGTLDGRFLFARPSAQTMKAEYSGTIQVADGAIGGSGYAIMDKELGWEGKITYNSTSDSSPQSIILTDGTLSSKNLKLDLEETVVTQENGTVKGQTDVRIGQDISVHYTGAVSFDNTGLKTSAMSTDGAYLHWQGDIGYALQNNNATGQQLNLSGELETKDLATSFANQRVSLGQGTIRMQPGTGLSLGETLDIHGKGSLSAQHFAYSQDINEPPLVTLDKLSIAELTAPGGQQVTIQETVADKIQVTTSGTMPLKIQVPTLELEGFNTNDLENLTAKSLTFQSPDIISLQNSQKLAGLNTLLVKELRCDVRGKVAASHIHLDDFFFLTQSSAKEKSIGQLASARLTTPSWSPQKGLSAKSLSFADLLFTLLRDKDGALNINSQLAAMKKPQPAPPAPLPKQGQAKNPGSNIKIDTITLSGDNEIHFEDHTLAVPFISDTKITTLQLTDLNSALPQQQVTVRMEGLLEERAPLEIKGTVAPFNDSLQLKTKIKLRNYPLANLSAYTVQSVGMALASGQLKIKSKLNIANQEMDMDNSLVLKKLETKTISAELAEELDNELPLPLDSALFVLKDSNNNINLDIPLSGPLSDLGVDITDILITALGKAVVPAASSYLMYTLGPYGALAYVGMKVGEKMLQVRLPPVVFPVKETSLSEEHTAYLERIAKIMQDRPDADINLCPTTLAWELLSERKQQKFIEGKIELKDAMKEKLENMGQERAKAVAEYLTTTYNIDSSRLLICKTTITSEQDAEAKVELQI